MEIIVDHLTRMAAGYICVAGIDPHSGRHIRPVIDGRLTAELLAQNGGPFEIGAIVDLGDTKPVGVAPEVEDHGFSASAAKRVGTVDEAAHFDSMMSAAELTLIDIFGQDLHEWGKASAVTDVGTGKASLGLLRSEYLPKLYVKNGHARCEIATPDLGTLDLSVTDVQFHTYTPAAWTVDGARIGEVQDLINASVPFVLAVGLTRPWKKDGDTVEHHWLQVNNVHVRPEAERADDSQDLEVVARPKSYSVADIRREYPNAYAPLTDEEDRRLASLYRDGSSVEAMSKVLGRQPGGVTSRLRKLRLID